MLHLLEDGCEGGRRIHQSVAHGQDLIASLENRRTRLVGLATYPRDPSQGRLGGALLPTEFGDRLPLLPNRFDPLERCAKRVELPVELLVPGLQTPQVFLEFRLDRLQDADVRLRSKRLSTHRRAWIDLFEHIIELGLDALERLAGNVARQQRIERRLRRDRAIRHLPQLDCGSGLRLGICFRRCLR